MFNGKILEEKSKEQLLSCIAIYQCLEVQS